MSNLKDKKILIAITGGIAAYKILDLLRRLQEQQAQVKVILTQAAKEFVTPLSVQAITGSKVYETLLDADNETTMSHITLARWADVILVAPATANFIAKCAYGLADDLLSTVCLATTAPILIAPAMNQQMWLNAATQHNVTILQSRNIKMLGPAHGSQACGEFGPGRMLEAEQLLQSLQQFFRPQLLAGKHVLITAGPTQEAIDPIRFISNHSSGKMGYALAQAALELGARVTLISGPTALNVPLHPALTLIPIISAAQMYDAVMQVIAQHVDYFVACAAVADYTPAHSAPQKIKKNAATLSVELTRTADILSTVAALAAPLRPYTIGFAAETENLLPYAQQKLQSKALDMLVANSVADHKIFGKDYSKVVLLNKNNSVTELPELTKLEIAHEIFNKALESHT
jgi:phosphopantothenoylcysteine decarboxylase/phosphopantothenate--cysteine ligase